MNECMKMVRTKRKGESGSVTVVLSTLSRLCLHKETSARFYIHTSYIQRTRKDKFSEIVEEFK